MQQVALGGRLFTVQEPVFRDLKIILAVLNRLNKADLSDAQIVADVQTLITCLIGDSNVRKFRRFCWEAWKIPAPNPQEIADLLSAIPTICGLHAAPSTASNSTNSSDNWDALYWRVARVTGWTFSQIDTEMTLSRLESMSEHLQEKPLVDELAAIYMGYEYTKPRTLEDDFRDWKSSQGRL